MPRNRHRGETLGNRRLMRRRHAAGPFTGAKPMLESVLIALLFSLVTYYLTFDV